MKRFLFRRVLPACVGSAIAIVLLASWAPSVTGLPIPGPSITPDASVEGGQVAIGEFFSPLPEGKEGFSAFFLGVARAADTGVVYANARAHMFLAGETCRAVPVKATKSKNGKKTKKDKGAKGQDYILRCTYIEHEGEIPLADFEMDPLLRTARLRTQIDGREVDVTWTGEGYLAAAGGGFGSSGDGAAIAGATAERWASAEGTIFGSPVRSGGDGDAQNYCFAFSIMFEGAVGFADVVDLGEGFAVPRRASEVSSQGVRSASCSAVR